MAYNAAGLTKVHNLTPPALHATKPGPALFLYFTADDALAAVVAAGYFNNARSQFKDAAAATNLVLVVTTDGFRIVLVTAPAAGNVTVAALLGAVS